MTIFSNLRLGIKLPLILVLTAFAALAVMGAVSYNSARALLEAEGTARLEQVLEARTRELDVWANTIMSDVTAQAQSAQSARMLREFGAGWNSLGTAAQDYIVESYITKNPNPLGQRYKMDTAGDSSHYSLVHRRYHESLVAEAQQKGYYDIFLINKDGNVMYTMAKEDDLGQNVVTGPLASSGLGELFARALKSEAGVPVVTSFAAYAPSAGAPAAFIGSPVFTESGVLLGVLAYQLPIRMLGDTMSRTRGLGETGQGYVVRDDLLAVSDLRLSSKPTTLVAKIETKPVAAALAGERGAMSVEGVGGEMTVSAYGPLTLFGQNHAVIVEQSTDELFAGARALTRSLAFHASWMMLALGVLAMFAARSVARPLAQVGGTMALIAKRNFEIEVPFTGRWDEGGDIAKSLENFRLELAIADSVAQDATLKGAAFVSGSSAMLMADTDFNIIYANPSFVKLVDQRKEDFAALNTQIDPHNLVGKSMDIFHNAPTRVREVLADSANLPYHANIVIGDARFALDISEVQMGERGRIGFVIEWRDVTEVQMNRAILRAIDANQATAEMLLNGQVIAANDNLLTAIGCSAADLIGRNVGDVLSLETETGAEILLRLRSKEPVVGQFRLAVSHDKEAVLQGAITPVLDRNNEIIKMVLITSDVTVAQREIVQAERERKEMQHAQETVVDALKTALTKLSSGDLRARIEQPFEGQYEQLRHDFNAATATLAEAMQEVMENANSIESEAREISNAAEDLSRRTEQQAATLEQTAAALDQLTSSVHSSADGATETNRVVSEARSSALNSGEVVKQAVSAMGEIESSSAQISKIITVIDDIAFQTNLLALNAGVEAARAGEAGRGFAVVASEVRALAQRSSEAAREIDSLISASSSHVRRGVSLVGEAGLALEGILTSVTDISARVSEIAASSQEQSAGLAEINTAVNQLDQVTQQNAAMFEEATAASHSLTRGAQALNRAMGRFQSDVGAPIAAPATAFASTRSAPAPVSAPVMARRSSALATQAEPEPSSDWEDF